MEYWHEIVKSYDSKGKDSKSKRNDGTYSQFAVVAIMMYLALGKDYPYNISKTFKELPELGLERNIGFGTLRHPGKVASLLKEMAKEQLVIGLGDIGKVKRRKFYKLNPEVLRSPASCKSYSKRNGDVLEIPRELIDEFLKTWDDRKSRSIRIEIIKNWSYIERFEFLTFLLFIKDIAVKGNMHEFSEFIEEYIQELEGPIKVDGDLAILGYNLYSEKALRRIELSRPYTPYTARIPSYCVPYVF